MALVTAAALISNYSAEAENHFGVSGSLIIGPSWGTSFTPDTKTGIENAADQISNAVDQGYDFYNRAVTDATKALDFDWSAGVYYTYDFSSEDSDALFGADVGLNWFSKTNTIDLVSSDQRNIPTLNKTKFAKVDSLDLNRQGLELSSTFKLYAMRFVGGDIYVDVGPLFQYAFIKTLKFSQGETRKDFFSSTESKSKEEYINSVNFGLKAGIGARLFDDFIEFRLLTRHWFMENSDTESAVAKSKGLGRYHFGNSEWDFQASVGINFV